MLKGWRGDSAPENDREWETSCLPPPWPHTLRRVQEGHPFVHGAALRLRPGVDPAAPGGSVTTALCGSWDHTPPCRWPHNNEITTSPDSSSFRTLFVAAPDDEIEIRERIEAALRSSTDWEVLSITPRDLTDSEKALGSRLKSE
jgi:hypothetical protein